MGALLRRAVWASVTGWPVTCDLTDGGVSVLWTTVDRGYRTNIKKSNRFSYPRQCVNTPMSKSFACHYIGPLPVLLLLALLLALLPLLRWYPLVYKTFAMRSCQRFITRINRWVK